VPQPVELDEKNFVRRLSRMLQEKDGRVVWFLGAGASVSSGIPTAAGLVERWLARLADVEGADAEDWEAWAPQRFTTLQPADLASSYSRVMAELFPTARQRQEEIERLTSGKDPAIGYALLASLAADENLGPRANVFVTTNFDDLIAEAMYLTTRTRPLVVGHDNLSDFVRRSNKRPLVVKLHGDALMTPLSTEDETRQINERLAARVTPLFAETSLVVLGYGGKDQSIARLLSSAPSDSFPLGVYWLSRRPPESAMWEELQSRNETFHVVSEDFDDFMLQLHEHLPFEFDDGSRWSSLFRSYDEQLRSKSAKARAEGAPDKERWAERTRSAVQAVLLAQQASELQESDPDAAQSRFEEALSQDPNNPAILGRYAHFLIERGEYVRAHEILTKAVDIAPEYPNNLIKLAVLKSNHLDDHDAAEGLYRKALEIEPKNHNLMGLFALFLTDIRHRFEEAEALYERALVAAPSDVENLRNFALFLSSIRGNHARAEGLYRLALRVDPTDPHSHLGLGVVLMNARQAIDEAEQMYLRAIELDPANPLALCNYAVLAWKHREDLALADTLYSRAIAIEPVHPYSPHFGHFISDYATFATSALQDHEKAEALFKRAIEADPHRTLTLSNYAHFLKTVRNDESASGALYRRASELDPNNLEILERYANHLETIGDYITQEDVLDQMLGVDALNPRSISLYAIFLTTVKEDFERADSFYDLATTVSPDDRTWLNLHLSFHRALFDNKEHVGLLLRQISALDPEDYDALHSLALHLTDVDQEHLAAAEAFDRLLELGGSDVNGAANAARSFLALPELGRTERGESLLEEVLTSDNVPAAVRMEATFYGIAHNEKKWNHHGTVLRELLEAGERSAGWSFALTIGRLQADGDARAPFLNLLADVIVGVRAIEELSKWPLWRAWHPNPNQGGTM
jgi:tetratricopeptide (TPR) repeat protein